MKIGYKVVRPDLSSIIQGLYWGNQYKEWRWTQRRRGYGALCVFNNLFDALSFIDKNCIEDYYIYECEYKLSKCEINYTPFNRNWFPDDNTIYCHAVKLRDQVDQLLFKDLI